MIFEILILLNILMILNVLIFYPLVLFIASSIFKKPVKRNYDFEPEVTIVVSAYNEEKLIKGAIESIYSSDYPNEKINVLVGSDGSKDNTVKILESLSKEYSSLKFFEFERIGKNAVLNFLVEKAKTDIMFYMDADLRIKPDTVSKMMSILADNSVGAVLAAIEIVVEQSQFSAGGLGESLYQKYEAFMRKKESDIFSNVNSLGTVYGIKKEVYSPIPSNLVCDDLYRMLITAIRKKRIIFDTSIVVEEVREKSTKEELLRRIRLVAGGLSTVWECREILNPKYGWVSFFVWNHKVLRWLMPVYLILIAIATFFLSLNSFLFLPVIISQIILYAGALIGWLLEKLKINILPFRILLFAVSMNIGFLLGLIRFVTKGQNAIWARSVNN